MQTIGNPAHHTAALDRGTQHQQRSNRDDGRTGKAGQRITRIDSSRQYQGEQSAQGSGIRPHAVTDEQNHNAAEHQPHDGSF